MLFQATLIAVITYLAACYLYGMYLLWKLYTGRRLHAPPSERPAPRELGATAGPADASNRRSTPAYDTPAKAA
ncbi:MAG: hypothetical protein AAF800_04715 [Planctomycetota bacterium]